MSQTLTRSQPGSAGPIRKAPLGQLLIEMGRTDEAGEKIRHAIEMSPDEPAAQRVQRGDGAVELALVDRIRWRRAVGCGGLHLQPS